MSFISEISSNCLVRQVFQEPEVKIKLQIFSEPCSPEKIVSNLAGIKGLLDIYTWYEGPICLPTLGAEFMKKSILEPLYKLKQDAKIYLYSLKAWDFKINKSVGEMPHLNWLGKAINRINIAAVECIYSSSFFQYCTQVSNKKELYTYINEELPKKKWLYGLSKKKLESGVKIEDLFNKQSSFFDFIKDLDVSKAYSLMQYIEGYYLIQESVKRGLENKQTRIEIAFVLPNDESKYYKDFPNDIQKMLLTDFGKKELSKTEINILFYFYKYESDKTFRPYIDKRPDATYVEENEVDAYFSYLLKEGY